MSEYSAEGGHGAVPITGVPVGPDESAGAGTASGAAAGASDGGAEGAPARDAGEAAAGASESLPRSRADRPAGRARWPLYEVFVRAKRGLNHVHVGSLRAADEQMALHHARDVYTRRNEGVSIWVVRSDAITASSPAEKDPFFAPSGDKVYRHPTFYSIPEDVPHL